MTTVAVYKATPPTLNDSDPTALQVDANGRLRVAATGANGEPGLTANDLRSTGTRTQVASSASTGTLLAANTARKGVSICNTDANSLYLVMGAVAATTTGADYIVAAGTVWESPFGYTGEIRGIWDADGTGVANIVEYA